MIAHDITKLRSVLEACRAGFELERVPMASTEDWSVVDGALQHISRGFFSVAGLLVGAHRAERIMLYQPQAAVTGVISCMVDGERCFLLQGRAEPGCLDDAQFGPTVQSTPANFLRAHGGAATPYVEAFIQQEKGISPLEDTTQLDLGERYYFKTKRSILLEAAQSLETLPAFTWATREAIYAAILESAFLNIDLRSILAITKWSPQDDGELTPRSEEIRQSLSAPVRDESLGTVVTQINAAQKPALSFYPLDKLGNWNVDEWGLRERTPDQNFAVDFFEVGAAHREVKKWIQPLVNSATEGHAVLACRENGGILEFFVQTLAETGLATGAALAPSYLRYPGNAGDPPDWLVPHLSNVWSETIESDEGGRFYQDVSRHQVVKCGDLVRLPPAESGQWLRLSELKHFLRTSNMCTIQLRGLSSHLLAVI